MKNSDGLDHVIPLLSPTAPEGDATCPSLCCQFQVFRGYFSLCLHCLSCSTRLEMGKWMEDLNVAIEMAKKSTEKSDMLLENSVCNRSNSK